MKRSIRVCTYVCIYVCVNSYRISIFNKNCNFSNDSNAKIAVAIRKLKQNCFEDMKNFFDRSFDTETGTSIRRIESFNLCNSSISDW